MDRYRPNDGVKLGTPIDVRPDEQAALETTGTQFSTDIADILNDDSLDLVVVVTPAPSHYEVAKQLLLAGKNVLVDKPMVETLALRFHHELSVAFWPLFSKN
ncbi:Gfo/Idh/MocA family oxidoreductase [Weissella confusa]|uniref:Gfo/Idh/MocA family oxidoreductase n=1 Tax=Weissella confusa TaxID=1583 RepID=A0A923NEN5_WEICO|nr:Gfo/Idh/MocA family oxidoreductase [Weissella confusa]